MPTKWYTKELPTSPVWILGAPFRFDILETSDNALITELDKCARQGIGGVSSITQEQYGEESKKKQDENLSANNSNPAQWRKELVAPHFQGPSAAGGSFAKPQQPQVQHAPPVVAHELPDALSVPNPEQLKIPKPPTAKLNKPAP